jgi:hypothetical protein
VKSAIALFVLVFLAVAHSNAAQLYRWVDSKGNVEWRDTPPPMSVPANKIEQRRVGDNVIDTSEAPYSVQLAAKNHPVTLWGSSDCGKICDGARAHLARRGVPFSDKNPQADLEGFKKVSPANEVPILQVGSITLKGYLESEWDSTLDAAGYPRTASAAKPKPAAPAPKPAAEGTPAPTTTPPPAAK